MSCASLSFSMVQTIHQKPKTFTFNCLRLEHCTLTNKLFLKQQYFRAEMSDGTSIEGCLKRMKELTDKLAAIGAPTKLLNKNLVGTKCLLIKHMDVCHEGGGGVGVDRIPLNLTNSCKLLYHNPPVTQ